MPLTPAEYANAVDDTLQRVCNVWYFKIFNMFLYADKISVRIQNKLNVLILNKPLNFTPFSNQFKRKNRQAICIGFAISIT